MYYLEYTVGYDLKDKKIVDLILGRGQVKVHPL